MYGTGRKENAQAATIPRHGRGRKKNGHGHRRQTELRPFDVLLGLAGDGFHSPHDKRERGIRILFRAFFSRKGSGQCAYDVVTTGFAPNLLPRKNSLYVGDYV